jgi:nucleoside-diphosphate-sugar epimerase
VIGPRGQFVSRIGRELADGLMLTVNGGRAHAGLIDIGNLVDAMLWAGRSQAAVNRAFNVRDPHDANWADFIGDLRRLIAGRGRVIDLPFWLADIAAVAIETPYRLLRTAREPLLHRLIVRMFGRTCGHSAARIQAAGCPMGAVSYEQSLERAAEWFISGNMA